jgi:hypothetical protein
MDTSTYNRTLLYSDTAEHEREKPALPIKLLVAGVGPYEVRVLVTVTAQYFHILNILHCVERLLCGFFSIADDSINKIYSRKAEQWVKNQF